MVSDPFKILLINISIERVGVEEIQNIDLGQTLSVTFAILVVIVQGPFDMLPMVIKGFVKIISNALFSLIDHSLTNGLHLLNHHDIETFSFLQLVYSETNLLERLMAKSFVNLVDDETNDIRDGVDFLMGKKVLNFEFIHVEKGLKEGNLLIR